MTGSRFEWFCAIDWSGAVGKTQKGIALAICHVRGGAPELVSPNKTFSRSDILDYLNNVLEVNSLVGFDFGLSLPFSDCGAFFPGWKDTPSDARTLWASVDALCETDENLAASSFVSHPQLAPYFRRQPEGEGALFRADGAEHGRGRFRVTEAAQAAMGCKPYSNFNLVGAAQVGKSSLTGMRVLNRLNDDIAVWPVDAVGSQGSVVCEIYTSLAAMEAGRPPSRSKMRTYGELNDALTSLSSPTVEGEGPIDDHSSDALLTAAWLRSVADDPARWQPAGLTPQIARTEGWTFGAL
ncbi:hypothetical protein [Altererythrobacter sp. ZODW24]|uniref:hypothetical protein n=1 Tax=Altererythrobacter sp. ZODW24 TaxID=2185142 RepID=UPI000DF82F5C|nr:hypothetical protein [Altererythrobacter sp. ZODW24]